MQNNKSKESFRPRYGNFSFKTYKAWLYSLILFLSISIIRKRIDIGVLIFVIVFMILQRCITHGEFYTIQKGSIVAKRFFAKKTIPLNDNLILIIARGSEISFPYRRLRNMDHLIELDDCYMVCIVDNCTLQEAINIMRWNGYNKEIQYSNVIIRELFRENTYSNFLYSFVYDPKQLQKITEQCECQIILPKSLEGKVDLSSISSPVHVDEEG